VKGGLLLDIVVRQSSSVLELLSSENQSLLIWRDSLLILNFGLDVLDGVGWLDLQGDGLTSERFDENLHTTSKSEDKMQGRLFLDVVVRQGSSVFKLLASKNQSLLIGGNAFLILNLGFHVLDGVGWLNFQRDRLAGESLDKDLHTASESKNQVKGRLFLDIIVGQGSTVLELFSSEDESLLIRGNALFVLNLALDVFNGVGWLDLQSDSLASQSLHENLHTTSESEHQVESRFFLNIVVTQSSAIFELFAGENQSLLIGWDALLVLNLGLDILDGVGWLDLQGNGLASQRFHENLHTATESENEMESGLLLDVVVG